MFEAVHGSAPRMIEEGLGDYASPESILRATVMMLSHVGLQEKADRLAAALDALRAQGAVVVDGTPENATCKEFVSALLEQIK